MAIDIQKKYLIEFNNVSFSYEKEKELFQNISFKIPENSITGICGLNGVGKSTILKLLLGIYTNYQGDILIKNKNLKEISKKERSLLFSYLGIIEDVHFQLAVLDLVKMGRYPYTNFWGFLTKADSEIINAALKEMDLFDIKNSFVNALSSGEKQRVHLARAIVQQTNVLLLDEPFAHLDLFHTQKMINLLKKKFIDQKTNIILISHDLNLVSHFCNYGILITKQGSVITIDPKQLFDKKIMKEVFNLDAYHWRDL
ncbi:MAG: ABC transporter ATP-binding protein [Candidatus Margulisiibacteriota bacterium]|jgi:iron complex transport system ATP-binding protein